LRFLLRLAERSPKERGKKGKKREFVSSPKSLDFGGLIRTGEKKEKKGRKQVCDPGRLSYLLLTARSYSESEKRIEKKKKGEKKKKYSCPSLPSKYGE